MKREIKNLAEFKELIKRYKTITLDEIKEENMSLAELTGFGSTSTCQLCQAIKANCKYCVYGKAWRDRCGCPSYRCTTGKNRKTYDAIENAITPKELLKAYRNRAKHLKERYSDLLNQ